MDVLFDFNYYNKELDRGVLWSSISFDWPVNKPILSERDLHHPLIGDLVENCRYWFNRIYWFHFTRQALLSGHSVLDSP